MKWDGSIGLIRAMVEAGNYKTHLIDGSVTAAQAGCDEGFLETIDWDRLGLSPDDLIDGAAHECGVGTITYSTLYAYRTDVYPDDPPGSWADFWNVEKYPGKRALKKDEAQATLEFALIADGVSTGEVYDVLRAEGGIDRAFAKLDEIKDHLIYWETGAHAPQLLADKEVVMTSGWKRGASTTRWSTTASLSRWCGTGRRSTSTTGSFRRTTPSSISPTSSWPSRPVRTGRATRPTTSPTARW